MVCIVLWPISISDIFIGILLMINYGQNDGSKFLARRYGTIGFAQLPGPEFCLITSQYGDLTKQIKINDNSQQSIKRFIRDYFGSHHDMLGIVAVGLVIFHVSFAILFANT